MQSMGNLEFEHLMLKDMNLSQCFVCFVCFQKGEKYCPCKDDTSLIEQKVHDADGVIFVTPVYGMNVSALMKLYSLTVYLTSSNALVFLIKKLFFSLPQALWALKKFLIISNW